MSANVVEKKTARKNTGAAPATASLSTATPVVGRTAWDTIDKVSAKISQRPILAVSASVIVVGVLVVLIIFGRPLLSYGKEGLVINFSQATNATPRENSLQKRIAAGRELKRPYILDAIVISIRLEDTVVGQANKRLVHWRIMYTVRALQRISKTDKLFKERYSTASAKIRRWFGTEKEVKGTDDAYNVMFDIAEGEARTIITGATFVYDLPMATDRAAFGNTINLTSNEEFFSYPNDEDVIGELVLLVESDSLPISPIGEGAKRSRPDGSIAPAEEVRFRSENQRSISVRWTDIEPKEEVGLHFKVGLAE